MAGAWIGFRSESITRPPRIYLVSVTSALHNHLDRCERERESCQEDSRLLISGNRLAVPPSILIESNGEAARLEKTCLYYLSFLTRPGKGGEGRPRLLEREWKRRNNETLPRLYGEFNFIRRLTATTRMFRREFRLSSPPAGAIFLSRSLYHRPTIPEIGTRLLIKERKEKKGNLTSPFSFPSSFLFFLEEGADSFIQQRSSFNDERNFIRVTTDRDRSCNLRYLF